MPVQFSGKLCCALGSRVHIHFRKLLELSESESNVEMRNVNIILFSIQLYFHSVQKMYVQNIKC